MRWRTVLPGAIFAAIGFEVVQRFFTDVMTLFSEINLVYGGFASIIVLLIWAKVIAAVQLFGAELSITWGLQVSHAREAIEAEERRVKKIQAEAQVRQSQTDRRPGSTHAPADVSGAWRAVQSVSRRSITTVSPGCRGPEILR